MSGRRRDRIAETHVCLHAHHRAAELAGQTHAYAAVFGHSADLFCLDGCGVENPSVILDGYGAHLAKDRREAVEGPVPEAEQVQVLGWPMG